MSAARMVPSAIGTSYSWPVRLSRTVRELAEWSGTDAPSTQTSGNRPRPTRVGWTQVRSILLNLDRTPEHRESSISIAPGLALTRGVSVDFPVAPPAASPPSHGEWPQTQTQM